ncbi:hypothetical protein WDW86_07915 [Bdellovibrionota bacterium FG-2]
MSFRNPIHLIFKGVLTALVVFGGWGCSVHEKEVPAAAAQISGGGAKSTACLGESFQTFFDYCEGKSSEGQITAAYDCISDSLKRFTEQAHGAKPGIYTPVELTKFLEKYFLADWKIPEGLVTEIMELKRGLLGGAPDVISASEIERLRNLFELLKVVSIRMRPFLPLSVEAYEKVNEKRLDDLRVTLESVADDLGSILQETGYPYYFSHLDQILKELEAIAESGQKPHPILTAMRSNIPTLSALKSILIAPSGDRIAGGEWGEVFSTAARWGAWIFRAAHFKKNYSVFMSGAGMEKGVTLAREALSYLETSVSRHPGEVIAFIEVDELFASLKQGGLPVTGQTVRNFVRPLVRRILGGVERGSRGRADKGISHETLLRAGKIVEHVSSGQRFLDMLFPFVENQVGHGGSGSIGFVGQDLLRPSLEQVLGLPVSSLSPVALDVVAQVRKLISERYPSFFGEDEEISFVTSDLDRRLSHQGLSKVFLMSEISHLLIESYAEDEKRAVTVGGLTLPEFKTLYQDVKELGIELRYFDPNNSLSAISRYQEANLFTFAANGDEMLSAAELTQELTFILSAEHLSRRIHNEIATRCPTGPEDAFGFPVIDSTCYRRELFGGFEHYWDRLGGVASYYRNAKSEDRSLFERNLEGAARKKGISETPVDSTDSESFAMIPHYVEAMFARFDRNHSGTLDVSEVLEGPDPMFPIFRDLLEKMSGFQDTDRLQALLVYLLKNGAPPKISASGAMKFWLFRQALPLWEIEADRGRIMGIFALMLIGKS